MGLPIQKSNNFQIRQKSKENLVDESKRGVLPSQLLSTWYVMKATQNKTIRQAHLHAKGLKQQQLAKLNMNESKASFIRQDTSPITISSSLEYIHYQNQDLSGTLPKINAIRNNYDSEQSQQVLEQEQSVQSLKNQDLQNTSSLESISNNTIVKDLRMKLVNFRKLNHRKLHMQSEAQKVQKQIFEVQNSTSQNIKIKNQIDSKSTLLNYALESRGLSVNRFSNKFPISQILGDFTKSEFKSNRSRQKSNVDIQDYSQRIKKMRVLFLKNNYSNVSMDHSAETLIDKSYRGQQYIEEPQLTFSDLRNDLQIRAMHLTPQKTQTKKMIIIQNQNSFKLHKNDKVKIVSPKLPQSETSSTDEDYDSEINLSPSQSLCKPKFQAFIKRKKIFQ
ncbi:UNKNOWN [Stylonychia lemnae]|uniref:Uncharacterized protein n=1 Tax=Stylonychia lemnae TaxID=5949 RepID=A0A077ZT56_STYLE|nr:UNKNOWN [Stylonychia lemnae]|eukprot:CDW72744.1 UNKNOWN [Stylonychia lemnae]